MIADYQLSLSLLFFYCGALSHDCKWVAIRWPTILADTVSCNHLFTWSCTTSLKAHLGVQPVITQASLDQPQSWKETSGKNIGGSTLTWHGCWWSAEYCHFRPSQKYLQKQKFSGIFWCPPCATGRDLAAGDLGNCKLPRGTLSAKES
jgi:hypothetical protein